MSAVKDRKSLMIAVFFFQNMSSLSSSYFSSQRRLFLQSSKFVCLQFAPGFDVQLLLAPLHFDTQELWIRPWQIHFLMQLHGERGLYLCIVIDLHNLRSRNHIVSFTMPLCSRYQIGSTNVDLLNGSAPSQPLFQYASHIKMSRLLLWLLFSLCKCAQRR